MWCAVILYPTTTATGTHDSTLSGRTAGWRALMKDTERPVERSKGCGAQATTRDRETFTLSNLAHIVGPYPRLACARRSGSWSSALSRRFKSRAPTISAVLRMRMEHSQRTIRAQSACSEAKEVKHGTMGLRCVLSRPGVGHLTRHCPPARCLRHHVKTVQAHREGFMRARSAANLSTGIAAATDPVVLVQPWLMTVAGWPVSIICAHLAGTWGGRCCTFAGCHRSTRWPSELVEGSLVSAQRAPEGS